MSLYLGENLISGQATLVGESRNIGQIIPSTIPLTDAGLHLLDGSLIQGDGIYSAFVTAMATIYETNPELFCTEQEWQQSITDYGVCGKFVYDSVNNTLRLQKFYSAERYLIASSSSGTEWYRIYSDGWCEQGGIYSGTNIRDLSFTFLKVYKQKPIVIKNHNSNANSALYCNYGCCYNITTTGFQSSVIDGDVWQACGYIDITDYAVSEKYEYIVIATSTKTDIQVDIDEVVTDLNGKADVDLSNCTKPHIIETYSNGASWYRVYSDGWCEQGGSNIDTGTEANESVNITFLKPFINTNYVISLSLGKDNTYPDTNGTYARTNKTTTSFQIRRYGSTTKYADWQASGYIN